MLDGPDDCACVVFMWEETGNLYN